MSLNDITSVLMCFISGAGLVVSWLNRRKIDQVHITTNSLAQRNEAIAKSLGIAEGKAKAKKEDQSK